MENNNGLIAAGYRICYYGVIGSDGYLIGNTATLPSAGANGSAIRRLLGATTAPIAVPDSETVPIPGDDGVLAQFLFGAGNLPNGVIEMSVRDMVFDAIATRTNVATLGSSSMSMGAGQPDFNPESLMFLFTRQSMNWDSTNKGAPRWESVLAFNTQVTPLQSEYGIKAPAVYRYSLSLSKTDTLTWGQTFTDAVHGRLLDALVPIKSNYPLHIIRYVGDGAETTFNLEFTPISVAETVVWVDGYPVTVSSVDTANKTFTLAVAPALNAKIVVVYGHEASEVA